jgi:Ca2+-binding RTX toxin-like protein
MATYTHSDAFFPAYWFYWGENPYFPLLDWNSAVTWSVQSTSSTTVTLANLDQSTITVLTGTDFVFDESNNALGGTVTKVERFDYYSGFDNPLLETVTDITMPLVEFQATGIAGALAGDDVINGGPHSDILFGYSGNDTFNPGGATPAFYEQAHDLMVGGDGNDVFSGGANPDGAIVVYAFESGGGGVTVNLGAGTATDSYGDSDTLNNIRAVIATNQNDQLIGGSNDETFQPGGGTDIIDGGGGFDVLAYSNVDLTFETIGFFGYQVSGITVNFTGAGSGTISSAFYGEDTFTGIEQVVGTELADVFNGSAADESFSGMAGEDILNGGPGIDEIDYGNDIAGGGANGVFVDLASGVALDGFGAYDTVTGIEAVRGTQFGDRITGDANPNRLRGEGGNDFLYGGAGNDMLEGGAGNDMLDGGIGEDTAVLSARRADVTMTLEAGQIVLDGPDGHDVLSNIEHIQFADALLDVAAPTLTVTASTTVRNSETLVNITGTNITVTLSGSNDTVNLSGANDNLTVSGNNDLMTVTGSNAAVTITGNSDPITFAASGSSLSLSASNDTLTIIGNNDLVRLTGNNDTVSVPGLNDTVTLTSANASLSFTGSTLNIAATNDAVTVLQDGSTALGLSNASVRLTASNDIVTIKATNDTLTLTGDNDTLQFGVSNANLKLAGNDTSVNVTFVSAPLTNDRVTLLGANDTIDFTANNATLNLSVLGSNDALAVTGLNDTVTLTSANASLSFTGSTLNIAATNDAVTVLQDGSTVALGLSNASLQLIANNDALLISGKNDTITLSGNGDIATLSASNAILRLTASNDTLGVSGLNDVVTLTGNNDVVNFSSSTTKLNLTASNDTVNMLGNNDSLTLTGNNDAIAFPTNTFGNDSITGLNASDVLQFNALPFVSGQTSAQFSGTTSSGVLTVSNGTQSVHLTLIGNFTGSTWTISQDPTTGGIDVVDPATGLGANAISSNGSSDHAAALLIQFLAASHEHGCVATTATGLGPTSHEDFLTLAHH